MLSGRARKKKKEKKKGEKKTVGKIGREKMKEDEEVASLKSNTEANRPESGGSNGEIWRAEARRQTKAAPENPLGGLKTLHQDENLVLMVATEDAAAFEALKQEQIQGKGIDFRLSSLTISFFGSVHRGAGI